MTDIVDVAAPFGAFGRPVERLVAWCLERLLTERNEVIAKAAANPP